MRETMDGEGSDVLFRLWRRIRAYFRLRRMQKARSKRAKNAWKTIIKENEWSRRTNASNYDEWLLNRKLDRLEKRLERTLEKLDV